MDGMDEGADTAWRQEAADALAQSRALDRQGRYEEALAAAERALALAPDRADTGEVGEVAEIWRVKGAILSHLHRYEEGLAAHERALDLAPGYASAWHGKAHALWSLKRPGEALAAEERALELNSAYALAWNGKGNALDDLGRPEEALAAYERALQCDPGLAMAWSNTGNVLTTLGRYEEALAAEERALELDPAYALAWTGKGNVLHQLRRYEEALAAHEAALDKDSRYALAWHRKGTALRALRRPEETLGCFDQALELDPEFANAWTGRGNALNDLSRPAEALAAFERALDLDSASVFAWTGKGNALRVLYRREEALAAYERTLALDAHYESAWLLAADAHDDDGQTGEALATIERALAAGQETASLWAMKAWYLEKIGNLDAAVTAYEEALRRTPAEADVWRAKAGVLYRRARYQEAADAADEALRLDPAKADGQAGNILRAVRRTTEDHRLQLPDGRWLGYLDYGDPEGTPILCFHGTPGSRLEFPDNEVLLRRMRVRLVAPDRPGYGLSDYQPGRCILDWPADVAALAEHLGLARFAVLGVSGGGAYAAACAYALPERVTTLGLVSSVGPREMPGWFRALGPHNRRAYLLRRLLPWPVLWRLHEVGARVRRADPEDYWRFQERFLPVADVPRLGTAKPAPVVLEQVAEPVRQGGKGMAWDMALAGRRWGFPLQAITAEAYVWYGGRDSLSPAAIGRYLAGALPHSQGICYPEEGHTLLGAHWQDVLTALTSHVRAGMPQVVPPLARDAHSDTH